MYLQNDCSGRPWEKNDEQKNLQNSNNKRLLRKELIDSLDIYAGDVISLNCHLSGTACVKIHLD